MRTILNDYRKIWHVKELAQMTGKAIGTVSNVKAFLYDHAWIREQNGGFLLCNPREMLCHWAKDYEKKDARCLEYYSLDSVADVERAIGK